MQVIADCHSHLYPAYDLSLALAWCIQNLSRIRGAHQDSLLAACLTERADCHVFEKFVKDGGGEAGQYRVTVQGDGKWLTVLCDGKEQLVIFPGRQIITAERLEVLALMADAAIPDQLPVAEVLRRTQDQGAIAVLPWSPGKWLFERGKVIRRLLEEYPPTAFLLGDTALRPYLYPVPTLIRLGRKRGFKVIAGSDPLPFAGEESRLGRYATAFAASGSSELDVAVRDALRNNAVAASSRGKRLHVPGLLLRLIRNRRARKSCKGPVLG